MNPMDPPAPPASPEPAAPAAGRGASPLRWMLMVLLLAGYPVAMGLLGLAQPNDPSQPMLQTEPAALMAALGLRMVSSSPSRPYF